MAVTMFSPRALEPDQATYNAIAGYESFRSHAYKPLLTDGWTIGYGYKGPDVHPGMVWTPAYAWQRLVSRVDDAADAVRALLTVDTSQAQFEALVSLGYNVGAGALHGSHIIAYHNAQQWLDAANEFPKWDHSGGQVITGLLARRSSERSIYLSGSPV